MQELIPTQIFGIVFFIWMGSITFSNLINHIRINKTLGRLIEIDHELNLLRREVRK